jgi:hypothetical protein
MTDARESAATPTEDAVGDAEGSKGTKRTFGGMDPAEAARRSHVARRAKAQGDTHVRVPIDRRKVIEALRKKAEAGDVAASRELREWLGKYAPKQEEGSILALLNREQRAQVRAWLHGRNDESAA